MAFQDALLQFAGAQAVTATAAGTGVYDVAGTGSGNATGMISGINATTGTSVPIGVDIGAGDGMAIPEVFWSIPTAFVSAGSATLQIALQAAPDNGSNSAGTYLTLVETEAMTPAQLIANAQGQFQVPPVPPYFGLKAPRFYRLNFIVGTSTFSAGNITASLVLNPSQATKLQNYPGNYVA